MKLYSKNSRLHNNAHLLNNQDAFINSHYDILNKVVERSFDLKNFRIRRQAWFDIEVAGRNYFNTPFIFKGKPK